MALKIFNPATEVLIEEVVEDTAASVKEKFTAAIAGQKKWALVSVKERVQIIERFRQSVANDIDELAAILTSEVGKPVAQSRNEIKGFDTRVRFFLEQTEKTLQPQVVLKDENIEERISFEPLGVVGNISAWNYPYLVGSNVFIPALLTGNAVLYKPSEFATLTGLAIVKRMHAAGVPKDVFVPVVGGGAVGAQLLDLPLAGIFFTGSYATGKKVYEAAAKRLMKVQLELGGKDPIYVCDDVDVATAAKATADGAFYNNGQSCCSVERIYVHEKIYDSFLEKFIQTVKAFKVGDPSNDETYIGALTREAQLGVLDAQVKDAASKGAKIEVGGKRISGKGHYFEPTVFSNVNHTMQLMRDESFGPLIGIQKVKSDDEALDLINDTEYGLTAGLYTRDGKRAEKLLAGVNAGTAYWNCCDRVSPRLPWSGRGHSGLGSTLSTLGILTFVQPKAWHLKK